MKTMICIVLTAAIFSVNSNEIKFDLKKNPTNIELEGRDRHVKLPHNVFVKSYKKSLKGDWLLLLYRYRSDQKTSSDYFSLLSCSKSPQDLDWRVHFSLFQPEMTELTGGHFRVLELGPFESPKVAILQVSQQGRLDTDDLEDGDTFWEKWNLEEESRIEVIRASTPFEKFE